MHQYELRHIRYFLAVAEELHFRKAAEKLYISQPGLSRQIKELEERLGVRLLERHSRKVSLTRAGSFLYQEFSMHLKRLEHAIHQAQLLEKGLLGELRIAYVGSAMQEIIPKLLLSFREKHPDVRFDLKEMDNPKQIEGLQAYYLDMGFVRWDRFPRGLKAYPVLEEPFCLVLPHSHPIGHENFESLRQFEHVYFILFDPKYSPPYYEKVMQIFDESGFTPKVSHSTIHSRSIYKLVENNFGVSIVPRSLQSELPGVKFIELNNISQRTTLWAVWKESHRNPILNHFIKEIES